MRIREVSAAILLTLLLAGCRSTLTLDRLTRDLRAGEINTLSLTPRVSLVSPFDLARTAEFESLIEGEIELVSELFEVALDEPVLFVLKPVEVEGFEVTEVEGRLLVKAPPEQPSLHGVGGAAGTGEAGVPAVVIFVAADGTLTTKAGGDVPVVFRFSYDRTIRHELAHVCFRKRGLTGDWWFREGVAMEVETMIEDRRSLRPVPISDHLPAAAVAAPGVPLGTILDHEEDVTGMLAGRTPVAAAPRLLAWSFVRYLLDEESTRAFPSALETIAAFDRAELLSREKGWRAWLGAVAGR